MVMAIRKCSNKFNFQLWHLTQARYALISFIISLELQFIHFFIIVLIWYLENHFEIIGLLLSSSLDTENNNV